jgi:hypothetical protein
MTNENPDRLEQLLDKLQYNQPTAPTLFRARLLAELPSQKGDDLLSWYRESPWRPVYAAVLPLLFGFGLGFFDFAGGDVYDVDNLLLATAFDDSNLSDAFFSLDDTEPNDE